MVNDNRRDSDKRWRQNVRRIAGLRHAQILAKSGGGFNVDLCASPLSWFGVWLASTRGAPSPGVSRVDARNAQLAKKRSYLIFALTHSACLLAASEMARHQHGTATAQSDVNNGRNDSAYKKLRAAQSINNAHIGAKHRAAPRPRWDGWLPGYCQLAPISENNAAHRPA